MTDIHITMLGGFSVAIDGDAIECQLWGRRMAAALVKVLALAPGHRLHRDQAIDLLWPDHTVDQATPKLHKAAHFARRVLGAPSSLVLRNDSVALLPAADITVDVETFEDLARRALDENDGAAAGDAIAVYAGELLPADPYEPWTHERREHLRLCFLDLLRLANRWNAVLEVDPSDEIAHLALMHRHAANGDRHAALRQFERMDRALRRELGIVPGQAARALRERLLVEDEAGGVERTGRRSPVSAPSALTSR